MLHDERLSGPARALAGALEPFAGQVYFSPECHAEYARLGFGPSPRSFGNVAMPDGPAYFTSRGSAMGKASGELVAAAFAVFNPEVVIPCVAHGWSLTDPGTIAAARTRGAVAQLTRILGEQPTGLRTATDLLNRAVEGLRPEGRPLYAGLLALGLPGNPVGDAWRLADMLREYRGDSHTAAWIAAGFNAVEICLLTELYWGLPMGTYIKSRAWSRPQRDEGIERLRSRGLLDGDEFSVKGREEREAVEVATDRQMRPVVERLGDDIDELTSSLRTWSTDIQAHAGYLPSGPHDLAAAISA